MDKGGQAVVRNIRKHHSAPQQAPGMPTRNGNSTLGAVKSEKLFKRGK